MDFDVTFIWVWPKLWIYKGEHCKHYTKVVFSVKLFSNTGFSESRSVFGNPFPFPGSISFVGFLVSSFGFLIVILFVCLPVCLVWSLYLFFGHLFSVILTSLLSASLFALARSKINKKLFQNIIRNYLLHVPFEFQSLAK